MCMSKNPSRSCVVRKEMQPAFTIVELLIVIGIITLLVSMLTPSLIHVKSLARAATTRAQVRVMSDALEMFYTNQVVGGSYPPSLWNCTGANGKKNNPYEAVGQDDTGRKSPYAAYGAQTLVWALAGADLLGTPGFVEYKMDSLYAIDSGKKPTSVRQEPMLDLTKVKIQNPKASLLASSNPPPSASVPVIVDSFGIPVLYYKADKRYAPYNYDRNHNLAFVGGQTEEGLAHPLASDKTVTGLNAFQTYIKNFQITAAYQPHNPEMFLLISAGADQRYGTIDDVTNFPLLTENCDPAFMP